MIQSIKNYIDEKVEKEVRKRVDRESTWRMKDIERLQNRVDIIMSEPFVDEVVDRINKKQVK